MRKILLSTAALAAAVGMQAATAWFAAPQGAAGTWSFGAPGSAEKTALTPVSEQQPTLFEVNTDLKAVEFTNGTVTTTVSDLKDDFVYAGYAGNEAVAYLGEPVEVTVTFTPMYSSGSLIEGNEFYIRPLLKTAYTGSENVWATLGGEKGIKMAADPAYKEGYAYTATFLVPDCYTENNDVYAYIDVYQDGVKLQREISACVHQWVNDEGKIVNPNGSYAEYTIPGVPVTDVYQGRFDAYTQQDGHNIMMNQGDAALQVTSDGSSWGVAIENLALVLAAGEQPQVVGNLVVDGLSGYAMPAGTTGDAYESFYGSKRLEDFMGGANVYVSGSRQGQDVTCDFTITLGEEYGNRQFHVYFYAGNNRGVDFSTSKEYEGNLNVWMTEDDAVQAIVRSKADKLTVYTVDTVDDENQPVFKTDLTLENMWFVMNEGDEAIDLGTLKFNDVEGLTNEAGTQYTGTTHLYNYELSYSSIDVALTGSIMEDGDIDLRLTLSIPNPTTEEGAEPTYRTVYAQFYAGNVESALPAPEATVLHGNVDAWTVQDGLPIVTDKQLGAALEYYIENDQINLSIAPLTLTLAEGETPQNLGDLIVRVPLIKKGAREEADSTVSTADRQAFYGTNYLPELWGGANVETSGWINGNDASIDFTLNFGEEYGYRSINVFFYSGDVAPRDFTSKEQYEGLLSAWIEQDGEKFIVAEDEADTLTIFTDGDRTDITLASFSFAPAEGEEAVDLGSIVFSNVTGLMTEEANEYHGTAAIYSPMFGAGTASIDGTVKMSDNAEAMVDMAIVVDFSQSETVSMPAIKAQFRTPNVDSTVGVENVEAAANGAATYYNLQGQRVSQPQNGVFVRVQNGKAVKVVK